jgi:hypothetical protein
MAELRTDNIGGIKNKPTTIDWWAFFSLCCIGTVVLSMCIYGAYDLFFKIEPALPNLTGDTLADVQASVNPHKLIEEELRAPFWSYFDLIVSRTPLPLVTLLMGFLFGKSKA